MKSAENEVQTQQKISLSLLSLSLSLSLSLVTFMPRPGHSGTEHVTHYAYNTSYMSATSALHTIPPDHCAMRTTREAY